MYLWICMYICIIFDAGDKGKQHKECVPVYCNFSLTTVLAGCYVYYLYLEGCGTVLKEALLAAARETFPIVATRNGFCTPPLPNRPK